MATCTELTAAACAEVEAIATEVASTIHFNQEVYDLVFYSGLKFWAIGLTIGMIISIIRKLRG